MTHHPQNRRKTGVPRTSRGQFPPGFSGNPGGRPGGTAGIAARVREHCGDDFGRLVDAWMCIAFGNAADRRTFFGEVVNVTAKDRLSALGELRDTAIGRPKPMVEHDGGLERPRTQLTIVVQEGNNPPRPLRTWRPPPRAVPEPMPSEGLATRLSDPMEGRTP